MLFSSPFFIFIFLPIFFLSFFIAGKKFRDYVLLSGSIAFYWWGEPIFCLIAIASALFDFFICKKIFNLGVNNPKAKPYVAIGIIANLALLIYFKYTNFFLSSINQLLSGKYHFEIMNIILPIGISFIVFEKITYIVDIHKGIGKPAKNILKYLTYVFLFPKLLAGPIIKYHEIQDQLDNYQLSSDDFFEGFKRFIRGLLKKVLIADTCAEIVNQVFGLPSFAISFYYAWLGIICFTLQIYFDFSGYSDMAIGLARMMGFRLRENFNMPYISASFTEFWRRWHISLSTWIRDYLYIPLGGNKVKQARMYVNLWLCFLLSGLWHGANWTFVLWGAYNGFFLVLDKIFWLKFSEKIPRFFSVTLTLFLIILGWVIFRSTDFTQLKNYLYILFNPSIQTTYYMDITSNIKFAIFVGTLFAIGGLFPGYTYVNNVYNQWTLRAHFEGLFFGILGLLVICKVVGVTFNPFLYFRF